MSTPANVRPAEIDDSPLEPRAPAGGRATTRAAPAVLQSGWPPALLVTAFAVLVLRFYGVPMRTTAVFLAYLALGIALPGTLLWRALHRRSGWFVADVAAGTALGFAAEVLVYIPARAIGQPLLVLLWPLLTVAAFLVVPGLRRFWRGSDDPADRTPGWWAWSLAAVFAVLVGWSGTRFFRYHGLVWPASAAPDADSPFHLALIGEAKHHMPLLSPWLIEEPVYYHWFVYAELAATSWVTGIEPQLLLLRLSPLAMLATFAVLIAVIARKLTGLWWTGPAAAVATFFVLAPNPYPWPLHPWFSSFSTSPFDDGSSFRAVLWTSPTHTFGAMLFAALVLVLVGLLRQERGTAGQWILFAVMVAAVMGGKATFLPMLSGALLVVVVAHYVARRRLHRPALIAAGLTAVGVLFAQVVLFGGASQGLAFDPLHLMRISGAPYTTDFTTDPQTPLWRLLFATALTVLCWCAVWAGIAGLLVRRRLLEPAAAFLLGVGAAGMGGILLFGHEGGAEGWFLVSARPYLSLAAVLGVAALIDVPKVTWRVLAALAGAIGTGALAVHVVRRVSDAKVPTARSLGGYDALAIALAWPYLVLLAVAVLFGVALFVLRHRTAAIRGLAPALVVSLLAGMGLFATYDHLAESVRASQARGWRNVPATGRFISPGAMEAGRWLRDHSRPTDLVATNSHCLAYPGTPEDQCDNRHFFVAAYSERRLLIEGWGFTSTTHNEAKRAHVNAVYARYWDADRLAANDAVFDSPSAATIGRLRDQYGVRWLFVDDTAGTPPADLDRFATRRFASGRCAVYEINR